ncbi:MAG: acetate kinase, partial [Muribaculaceae bacterium]|nr:acetate kinase [Muribaculaceae bacterium]
MKILVLNCGSSSVKYKLIDSANKEVLAEGGVEKIGLPDSFLKFKRRDGSKEIIETPMPTAKEAVKNVLDILTDPKEGVIKSFDEIDAVGHRVVHGMEEFNKSVLITPEVIEKVKECYPVAPLHNPANVTGIEAVTALMPDKPQVAVFDTAFHQTMPAKAYMYALPYEAYEKYGVRRYGFHGTSHRYVSRRACEFLGLPYEKQRIITCHIGNGASITAIADGKSVDTSMGLTPTEGLMMGTRVGDVDPGAIVYMMEREGLDAAGVSKLINKQSGVAGVTELSSDMRDIEAAVEAGNERAQLALDMYEYRILKYIGAYTAVLGGVDVIVFTGGVGENQIGTRERICKQLAFMGVTFNAEANKVRGEEIEISGKDSKVHVVVIPTDEE